MTLIRLHSNRNYTKEKPSRPNWQQFTHENNQCSIFTVKMLHDLFNLKGIDLSHIKLNYTLKIIVFICIFPV